MSQATSLSVSPDGTRVAVSGREMLSTFTLGGSGPSDVVDLLAHTRKHSSHSSNDVTWLVQRPTQLATASISGEVLLWDTTRRGSKLLRTMAGHRRAVNRVSCNASEPPRLLSASQDCTVRLWDLHARTAMQLTFEAAGEVRDVQWASPVGSSTAGAAGAAEAAGGGEAHLSYCFAAALETGSVQLFDYRSNRRALHTWQAHLVRASQAANPTRAPPRNSVVPEARATQSPMHQSRTLAHRPKTKRTALALVANGD